jgi:LuxR family maltose regulon positive regulatory protein
MSLATRAVTVATDGELTAEPLCGIAYLALGRAMTRQGDHAGAEEQLERALDLFGIDGMAVHRAHAQLLLATVHHQRGDPRGARTLLGRGRELIEHVADPGMLPTLLEQARRMLDPAPGRRVEVAAPLTERELVVLRLLPTRLSTPEISRHLNVSVNTVRSQVRAIYRKLEVTTRSEAVATARQTGLLPGSTTTACSHSPR